MDAWDDDMKKPRHMTHEPLEVKELSPVKITMLTCAAGPDGVARRGTVLDVPQQEAEEMIKGLYARNYDKERDAKAPVGRVKAPENFE
jgi:hypothetical protein